MRAKKKCVERCQKCEKRNECDHLFPCDGLWVVKDNRHSSTCIKVGDIPDKFETMVLGALHNCHDEIMIAVKKILEKYCGSGISYNDAANIIIEEVSKKKVKEKPF